jgi:hypothetical protein
LRTYKSIFQWLDMGTFQQYVFEAKRNGVAINFTLNADDKIAKLYFCLTVKMVRQDAISTSAQHDKSGSQGPLLCRRYMLLFQALRKCVTDQGYALGNEVDDELLRMDNQLYHKIQLDSFFDYVIEAKMNKAPIDTFIEVDHVERIWFRPTENMVSGNGIPLRSMLLIRFASTL